MSATKRFYENAAEIGMFPANDETWKYLDALENSDQSIDWIEYCEYEYAGHDGKMYMADAISVESALKLVSLGLANDEIKNFVECFGGFWRCNDCGRHGRRHYFVNTGAEILCVDCG